VLKLAVVLRYLIGKEEHPLPLGITLSQSVVEGARRNRHPDASLNVISNHSVKQDVVLTLHHNLGTSLPRLYPDRKLA